MAWLEKPIKGVLLDISGVLRDGDVAIPGSIQAFNRLRETGLPVRLVTNESQVTREVSQKKLVSLGYESVLLKDILSPAPVLAELLKAQSLRPHLLIHPNARKEFEGIETKEPNCVVLGDAAEHFTYEAINQAFRVLLNLRDNGQDPRLFTLGKGRYYKEGGELWLDVGPYAAGLEYALGIKSELVGKPSATFFEGALKDMGIAREDVVMIGDDIIGDVKGAQDAGLRGVLVRTGKFRASDESHPQVKPDAIVNDLTHAVDLIISKQQS